MAKITRYTGNMQAFASAALGTERTIFGSTSQSDSLDANIVADWLRGWGIVGPSDDPTREDFNGALFTATQLIAYLHQWGVAEWDSAQEFNAGSIANVAGVLYVSQVDANIGNDPTADDGTNWIPLSAENETAITGLAATDVTLTMEDAAAGIISLDGTLTANVNVVLPAIFKQWIIVNNTTGAYTVTVKTAAGAGVPLNSGTNQVYCDGTDIQSAGGLSQVAADARYAPAAGDSGQAFQVSDATAAADAVALGQFISNFASAGSGGYLKLPGGIILQWGNSTAGSGTFPITFPNGALQLILVGDWNSTTAVAGEYLKVATITSSGYTSSGSNSGIPTRYLVIGY